MNRLRQILTLGVSLFLASQAVASSSFSDEVLPRKSLIHLDASPNENAEVSLHLHYEVTCGNQWLKDFPAIQGTVYLKSPQKAQIRFELWQGTTDLNLSVGTTEKALDGFVFLPAKQASKTCKLLSFEATYKKVQISSDLHSLAKKYSPYLVVRQDEMHHRETDNPLALIYSFHCDDKNLQTIKYTMIFSDEDTMDESESVKKQFIRYGRSSDVEWLYEVTLNDKNEVVSRRIQKNIFDKLKKILSGAKDATKKGHSIAEMKESELTYWPGSLHPILYNMEDNNVFDERPDSNFVGYHSDNGEQKRNYVAYQFAIDRAHFVDAPLARESFQFTPEGAFTMNACNKECMREKKNPGFNPSALLFLHLSGDAFHSEFKTSVSVVNTRTGKSIWHEDAPGSVDRLGESMYENQSYSGIYLSAWIVYFLKRSPEYRLRVNLKNVSSDAFKLSSFDVFSLGWNRETERYEKSKVWTWSSTPLKKTSNGYQSDISVTRQN